MSETQPGGTHSHGGADDPLRKDWVNRIPIAFFDHRKNGGRDHRHSVMLVILDGHCRKKAHCWVSNRVLAKVYGCKDEATIQRLLREMEDADLLARVLTKEGRRGRVGIVLLVRANPELPVADRETLPDVVAQMSTARARSIEHRAGAVRN